MSCTWNDVLAIAPDLASVPLTTQQVVLAYANRTVTECIWGDDAVLGCSYLAAHMGAKSLAEYGAGDISSESVGDVSAAYSAVALDAAASDLHSTKWGRIYLTLAKALPGARGPFLI